jgi:hypothetical protein
LDTNTVDIDQAPNADFDYNEMDGGVDGHGGEDEVEEIDEGVYAQAQVKKGARSKNYTLFEDQILIKAWSAVSLDACTGTSQTAKRYWQRIEDQYFRMMARYPGRTPRTFRSLQCRWDVIKPICSRWAACLEQVRNAPPSGTVESDYVSLFSRPKLLHHLTLFICVGENCPTKIQRHGSFQRQTIQTRALLGIATRV